MTIIFKIDDFLFEIFPVGKGNINELEHFLKKFYSDGPFEAKVDVTQDIVKIEIDTARIEADKKSYQKLISLSENGKFSEAKSLVKDLLDTSPNISEYHRILGQILSEEGNQDEAINSLIDALRWNPQNEWALLMMGNIFAKYKEDVDTAMKYYDQVLVVKPDDNIALNNIGANLMQLGRIEEALTYFNKAIEINPEYPNTHYALAMVHEMTEDYDKAFHYALQAIRFNTRKDGLYGNSLKIAIESAYKFTGNIDGKAIVERFASKLEKECGKSIRVEIDEKIPTAAKIEIAENYGKDFHLVKYKSSYPAVEHLVMHELMHLELVTEARAVEENQLFVTNHSYRSKFFYSLEKFANSLHEKGISEVNIAKYLEALFEGINRQVYNTAIDLFIEDRIYRRYPELKPFQFLSWFALIQEGIQATTRSEIVNNSPKNILSKSKIFNIVNAIHFKDLYNVDLVQDHKPTKSEENQANDLYLEFLEYREDKAPGEEYELVQHWAEDLKLDAYFDLVPENVHNSATIDDGNSGKEVDPVRQGTNNSSRERKMKNFLDSHTSSEINNAVVMYMISAIEYFRPMAQDDIKKHAFELYPSEQVHLG